MSRDRRLRQTQVSRQIDDPMIAKGKMSQNRQPGRIPETTKQTRRRRQPSRFIDELSNVIYRFHRHSTMLPPTPASCVWPEIKRRAGQSADRQRLGQRIASTVGSILNSKI
jgi:hypothetical protein